MAREFFKNLPDTTTPITAPRMNGLLDGDEAMGNILVDSIKSKNMFDKNAVLQNYELIGSGTYIGGVNENAGWYVSDYIEVEPNTTYYLTKNSSGSSNCFYNSSKTYITSISASNGVITVPNNSSIKYIRFNGIMTDLDNVQFEKGSTGTDYAEYQGLGYVSGQNSNGKYIKYSDGTMICWNSIGVLDQAIDSSYGNNLFTGSRAITFPVAFAFTPTVTCSQFRWGTSASWGEVYDFTITGATLLGVDAFSRAAGTTVRISWIAIGRWK